MRSVAEAAIFQTFIVGYVRGDPKQARVWADLADSTLRRLGGHGLWRAWLVNNRGVLAHLAGHNAEALAAAQESLRLKEQILGPDHPDVALSLGNVAFELSTLKRMDEALNYSERAVAIDEKIVGVDHPDTALQLENRAEFLNAAGRFNEADGLARRALSIWQREMGPDDPLSATALTIVGRSSLAIGNIREATANLERAYAIRRRSDSDPSRLAETGFLLAQALWQKRMTRQQAITLAIEAKTNYAQVPNDEAAAEVSRWLAAHDSY